MSQSKEFKFMDEFFTFFKKHANKSLIDTYIALLISSQMSILINNFTNNIIFPIIDYLLGQTVSKYTIQIGKSKIKIGEFFGFLLSFIISLWIVFIAFDLSTYLPSEIHSAVKNVSTAVKSVAIPISPFKKKI